MNKKYIMGGAAALILLGSAFALLFSNGETLSKSDVTIDALLERGEVDITSLDSELLADFLSYRMIPGKAYNYGFQRAIRGTFGGKEIVNLRFKGLLTANVVRAAPAKIDLIVNIHIQEAQGLEKELNPSADNSGTYTIHLSMDRKGNVIDTRYPSSMAKRDDVAIASDILAKWITALPDADGVRRGRTKQLEKRSRIDSVLDRILGQKEVGPLLVQSRDALGDYTARLIADQGGGGVKIQKSKVRYTRSVTFINIVRSANHHLWDEKGGYFRLIRGAEHFSYGGKGSGAGTEQDFRFDFKGISRAAFNESDLDLYRVSIGLYQPDRGNMKAVSGAPIKPWKEIKPMLAKIRPDASRKEKNRVFNTLASSLKSNPALTQPVLQAVRTYGADTEQYKMLMGAVTYSGSVGVQKGLIDIFRAQETAGENRKDIIQAFTMMDQPFSPSANRFLTSAFQDSRYSDIRDNIGFAMGSALRNRADDGRGQSETEKIREMLMEEWRNAGTQSRRRTVMEMLGNSGDEFFLDTLVRVYEESGNVDLGALAIYSMRFMDSDKVGRYIISVLQSRTPMPVRLAALEALAMHSFRSFYFEPLVHVLRNPGPSSLRMKSAEVLMNHQDPRIQEKVRAVLSDIRAGVDPDFRRHIDQLLRQDA